MFGARSLRKMMMLLLKVLLLIVALRIFRSDGMYSLSVVVPHRSGAQFAYTINKVEVEVSLVTQRITQIETNHEEQLPRMYR